MKGVLPLAGLGTRDHILGLVRLGKVRLGKVRFCKTDILDLSE